MTRPSGISCGFSRRGGASASISPWTGVDALDKLAVCSYDLAIIDLMMPRLNGYDLARDLIDHEERPTVVIASAMTDELVAKLDARYVHSIIRKPFDVDMVGSLMTEIVAAVAERSTNVVEMTDPGPRILGVC